MFDTRRVAENLATIRSDIERLGRPGVQIVAVTKGHPPEAITIARDVGLFDVGESYAQELDGKRGVLDDSLTVHFVGRLQRNKVRKIADVVSVWHSIARPEQLREVAKRRSDARIFLQVNVGGQPSKDGADPNGLDELLKCAETHQVEVLGLMTIGVKGDEAATRAGFSELAELAVDLGLPNLSMGMSGDYRDALEAGATHLRLGSVLFGNRPSR